MSEEESELGGLHAAVVTADSVDEIIPVYNKYRKTVHKGGKLRQSREFLKEQFEGKSIFVLTAFTGGDGDGEDEDEDEEEKQIHGMMILNYRPNPITLGRDLHVTDEFVSPILSVKMKEKIGEILSAKLVEVAKTLETKMICFDVDTESRRTQQFVDAGFVQEKGFHFQLAPTAEAE